MQPLPSPSQPTSRGSQRALSPSLTAAGPAFGVGNPSPPPSITLRALAPSAPPRCQGQQADDAAAVSCQSRR